MSLLLFWEEMQRPVKGYPHWHFYHRKHRLHRSFLVTSFVLTIIILLSFGSLYVQTTSASQLTMFTLNIVEPSAVQVNPAGGGSSGGNGTLFEPSPILNKPNLELQGPAVNFSVSLVRLAGTDNPDGSVSDIQGQTKIPIITQNAPVFHGKVGLANAIIVLEIHSAPSAAVTATIKADQNGDWSFTVPHPLPDGLHILYVSIFGSKGQPKLASAVLEFIIDTQSTPAKLQASQPISKNPISPSLFNQGQLLFDVRATVPASYASISPGQDLLVQLDLVNLSSGSRSTDVTVFYKIKNQKGDVFLDQSETLAVTHAASFIRLFRTAYRLPPDQYTFEMRLPYNDGRIEAFSSDSFVVQGEPVISFAGGAKVNINLALQGLALLLAIFVCITYYEYKQVEGLAKIIHHITGRDLIIKGFIKA